MPEMPKLKLPKWLIILASVIIPSSGHVLMGRPMRALIFLFFMGLGGLITFNLSGPNISPIGRFSGGIAIWAVSVVEVYRAMEKRGTN